MTAAMFWRDKSKQFLNHICDCSLEVIEAVMLVTQGKGRFSAHVLKNAILLFFTKQKLYPKGMCSEMDCVDAWGLRMGQTTQRLVTCIQKMFCTE